MGDEACGYSGVQFHPEVTHTLQGMLLLERFALKIASARLDWVMRPHHRGGRAHPRASGSEVVILSLSGGVDSSVAAALINRAIGDQLDQLTCAFVDHGLLRLNEAQTVMDLFASLPQAPLTRPARPTRRGRSC
jgi:GMP synthase (glutamine-hydrolysing)